MDKRIVNGGDKTDWKPDVVAKSWTWSAGLVRRWLTDRSGFRLLLGSLTGLDNPRLGIASEAGISSRPAIPSPEL